MKLLVSPKNIEEARQAIDGGTDIVDCKNPEEGSLGANFPWIITGIKEAIETSGKKGVLLSATIGDMPNLPGTASLAATGIATLGVDYVKVGVYGPRTKEQAQKLLDNIVKAVKRVNANTMVVAAGYADHARARVSLPPLELVPVAAAAGCEVVMVDTAIKDGKGLLDFMSHDQIQRFCDAGKKHGMAVALAGRLQMKDIPFLKTTGVDIIGVRSMVIRGADRISGSIDAFLVKELKKMLA
nr:(5-formylfuran-3-yl)methyl phosphate synthase [Candidatus Sigynarchaeota archaeon]